MFKFASSLFFCISCCDIQKWSVDWRNCCKWISNQYQKLQLCKKNRDKSWIKEIFLKQDMSQALLLTNNVLQGQTSSDWKRRFSVWTRKISTWGTSCHLSLWTIATKQSVLLIFKMFISNWNFSRDRMI